MNLDVSIAEINDGTMLDKLLKPDAKDHYGWFWQLKDVPDAAQSRYLYHLLAGHDFQEGLKNYRDLAFMGSTLARWQDSVVAFDDMLDTRERAYAERVPQADAVLASGRLDNTARNARWRAASSTRSRRRRTWRRSAPPKSVNSGRASCVSNPRCSPRPTTKTPM